MTGITDPTEQYFKDGLWAWVTNAWVKLVATAGGLLKIQIGGQDADVEVKQTTPADLTPGITGWDGAAWQKLPLLFGYSTTVGKIYANINLAAGTNFLDSDTVPAGYIWVITNLNMVYVGTTSSRLEIGAVMSGVEVTLFRKLSPTSDDWIDRQGQWILKAGDYLRCGVFGATAGDRLYFQFSGYAMAVT